MEAALSGSKYRNFPMVPRVIFGSGSFDQLGEILMPRRRHAEAPVVYLVDDIFELEGQVLREGARLLPGQDVGQVF